jgi:hypothetical protein
MPKNDEPRTSNVSEANSERASGSERNELGALAETTPEAIRSPVSGAIRDENVLM